MRSDTLQREGGEPVREVAVDAQALRANQLGVSAFPPTSPEIEARIRAATVKIKPHEASFSAQMEHMLHGGMYARTARIAPAMAFTSVLIKLPTVVIVHGECCVYLNGKWEPMSGYQVLAASAHRIQAYVTFSETEITMLFPSDAKTVEEAEREFTDEADELLSRRSTQ